MILITNMTQSLLMSLFVQAIQLKVSLSLFVFSLHNKLGGYSHLFSFFLPSHTHIKENQQVRDVEECERKTTCTPKCQAHVCD